MTADALGEFERPVVKCARCGLDHSNIVYYEFERPVAPDDCPGVVWTHWGICPTTLDPILWRRT